MSAPDRILAARCNVDDAARLMAQADIAMGDPDFDRQQVERWLLDSLKYVLNSLALLRGGGT